MKLRDVSSATAAGDRPRASVSCIFALVEWTSKPGVMISAQSQSPLSTLAMKSASSSGPRQTGWLATFSNVKAVCVPVSPSKRIITGPPAGLVRVMLSPGAIGMSGELTWAGRVYPLSLNGWVAPTRTRLTRTLVSVASASSVRVTRMVWPGRA